MAGSTLKVGAIGIGGIFGTHMPGWEKSEHADVVAGADINADVLNAWGAKHDVTRLHTDPADLFRNPDIDIVDICAPSMFHADLAIAALEAGKHVICEKPLAPTPDDIQRMIVARDKSGKLLMTAQHERYHPYSQALKREVDKGILGDVYHARAWFLRRNHLPTGAGFVYKRNSGGGPCIDIGVHVLDLALWLMGNPEPHSVTGVSRKALAGQKGAWSAWGGDVPEDMDVEDFASGFVRFKNGATLVLEVSWMLHHPGPEQKVWVYGTDAGLTWPEAVIRQTDNDARQAYDTELKFLPRVNEAHAAECIDFARAVAEGGESPVPAENSLQVQSILNGLYESSELGREVVLTG